MMNEVRRLLMLEEFPIIMEVEGVGLVQTMNKVRQLVMIEELLIIMEVEGVGLVQTLVYHS